MTPGGDGPARRKRSDAALNYAAIIDAARRVLAENSESSVQTIAAEAGVGRGTVYRHFPSREDLLAAVRRQARDDAESDEEDYLREPGELANVAATPLSVADVLNKVPPFQLGDQIVAEAQRLRGVSSAALYVVDLEGATMQRLAGAATFPPRLPVPLSVGPEIPREGVAALRASVESLLPGTAIAPLHLRGRAIGVLLAVGNTDERLRDLAQEAAVALALAPHYTDHIDTARRTRPTSPAAEIQQNLLPPRIARVGGAMIAGNVLPGYEIGGDWFDYAENPDGAWVGIADSDGTGPGAASIGAVLLGAFRAQRRTDADPADSLLAMHAVLGQLPWSGPRATATIGRWNAPASSFEWVTGGDQAPVRVTASGELDPLAGERLPELGDPEFPASLTCSRVRLEPGERLLLLSDGILKRRGRDGRALGLEGVAAAVARTGDASASATVRAIEDALRADNPTALEDDATLIVLAPADTAPADV